MSDKVLKLLLEKNKLDERDFIKGQKNPFQRFADTIITQIQQITNTENINK